MPAYPYDKAGLHIEKNTVMKQTFQLSFELMLVYEPFGQSGSTYEDTGYPEYTALGLRTFLSVEENIKMLRDIGKATYEHLVKMGCVYTTHGTNEEKAEWKRLMSEMKRADKRTYESIQKSLRKEVEKCHKE